MYSKDQQALGLHINKSKIKATSARHNKRMQIAFVSLLNIYPLMRP